MAIIGIDLGTTNSLGAVWRNGRVELIPNRFGSYLTPSVVSVLDDGSVVVGQIAKERLVTHPKWTVASFKKDMGTKKKFRLGKQTFLPEELSSFVIRSILDDARVYLDEEIEEAIISVPAYFHDQQRVATKLAGQLAGVKVDRIINEPSAAAMASYFETSQEQQFLVFDFGGGTLDVSIVDCFDTMVEILSVSGDNQLGGDNFHGVMVAHFLAEHNLSRKKLSDQDYAILIRQAELCKQGLTTSDTSTFSAMIDGKFYQSEYTQKRLAAESSDILSRIKNVLTHALRDGDFTVHDIYAVIMAGGSSKMPMIQRYIQHLFRGTPLIVGNSDELIARGLGIICGVKARNESVKDYVLTDICPFTLGVNTHNASDPNHDYMSSIISRNTMLPCSRVERYYTSRDFQGKVEFKILQGEHPYAEDNLKLADLEINVPKRKKGEEAIEVRFTYDINGILIVDITVVSTGEKISKIISQETDDAKLAQRMKELEHLKVHPKDLSENRLVMEQLMALYEIASPDSKEYIGSLLRNFDYLLNLQNPRKIKHYREYLEEVLAQTSNYDPFATDWDTMEKSEPDWHDDIWDDNDDWNDDNNLNNKDLNDHDVDSDDDDIDWDEIGGNHSWTS